MNLKPEDAEICQEDYWIRRLFRERFGNNLWRRAPGSSKINPTYEVESISENDGALKVTYYTIATGFRNIKTIAGDKDICKRYIIYETELSILADYLEGQGVDLTKHKNFEYWQKQFILHRKEECENVELHEMEDEDELIAIPVNIELEEKSSEYSLVLYYEYIGDNFNIFQSTAASANEIEINELISFITNILDDNKEDQFSAVISDEFGVEVPNYSDKDKSKNRSVFVEVAGTIEDLAYDEKGENSKEYESLKTAIEKWL